jgi:hypothetical protein
VKNVKIPPTIPIIVIALSLASCAFGNTIDYRMQPLTLAATTGKTVAVGVDDERPYVVSGEHTPEFVGVMRSGAGLPFGVHTTFKQALASDFSASILNALRANGVTASAVSISRSRNSEQTAKALTAAGTDRLLLVTLTDWKSDKYLATTLTCAMTAEVLNADGNILASSHADGEETIGADMLNPVGNLERGATDAARHAIRQLLDDRKIVEALR